MNANDLKRVDTMQMNDSTLKNGLPSAVISRRWVELAVFCLIVMIGVASRHWLLDFPNFKPVAALCLFAGFYFRRYSVALIALVAIMLISDWQLGSYQWQVALAVYGSLVLACGLGWLIKQHFGSAASDMSSRHWAAFGVCSLAMSTTFYVLTNWAVWQFSGWYPGTAEGLAACFSAAVPFYRWTLMGDLTFTLAVVGLYQLGCVMALRWSQQPRLVAAVQE